jgi:vancomycin resistance protein YoaR
VSLVSWLDYNGSFDLEKINQYATTLASSLRRDPVDAYMKLENNKVLDFRPARDGLDLDIPQTTAFINENAQKLLSGADKTLSLELPSKKTPPNIPNEAVNNLGIKELLGRGRSTFHHSSAIRNHNIANGASKVNRVLVAPGETFSFTQNLGPVGAETGFKEAYVIKATGTELEYGGGV